MEFLLPITTALWHLLFWEHERRGSVKSSSVTEVTKIISNTGVTKST